MAKRPGILFKAAPGVVITEMVVVLDNMDVTGLVEPTEQGFALSPLTMLPAGEHRLMILANTREHGQIQGDFNFRTRHHDKFQELYTEGNLMISAQQAGAREDGQAQSPDQKTESNLGGKLHVKQDKWQSSLGFNLRHLDQSEQVEDPEQKGINIADYLWEMKYQADKLRAASNLGDVTMDETPLTVSNLSRRGGSIGLGYSDFDFKAFMVSSPYLYGFQGGMGLGDNMDGQIAGFSLSQGLWENRIKLKVVHSQGSEQGSSFGESTSDTGRKEGHVWGLAVSADLFEQKLVPELEMDFSSFDPDTNDEFGFKDDQAYRVKLGGVWGDFNYQAAYERIGCDYGVVGNESITSDREGFSFGGGWNSGFHAVNAYLGRFRDNVEDSGLFPVTYRTDATLDYSFTRFASFPISLSYMRAMLDSDSVPENSQGGDSILDSLSASLNYLADTWSLGLQTSYSMLDDNATPDNSAVEAFLALIGSYTLEEFSISPTLSFGRSDYDNTGLVSDTYVFNLDIRGYLMERKIAYGLTGSYSTQNASDNSVDQDILSSFLEVSYRVAENLGGYLTPYLGLRCRYDSTTDNNADSDTDDFSVYLVLTFDAPYSW